MTMLGQVQGNDGTGEGQGRDRVGQSGIGWQIEVLHTPRHSPGHMCFYEKERGLLFTGDFVYVGTLFAYYPSTDPVAYQKSIQRVAALPVKRILPAHHDLDVPDTILTDMENAFCELHTMMGIFQYGFKMVHIRPRNK